MRSMGLIELFDPAAHFRGSGAVEQRRGWNCLDVLERDGEAAGHRLRSKLEGVVHGV